MGSDLGMEVLQNNFRRDVEENVNGTQVRWNIHSSLESILSKIKLVIIIAPLKDPF